MYIDCSIAPMLCLPHAGGFIGSLFSGINQMFFFCNGTPNHGSKSDGKVSINLRFCYACLRYCYFTYISAQMRKIRSDKHTTYSRLRNARVLLFQSEENGLEFRSLGPPKITDLAKIRTIDLWYKFSIKN